MKKGIPVILVQADKFIQLSHGLEESLFTHYSRLQLSKQLTTMGMERVTIEPEGLSFPPSKNTGDYYAHIMERDAEHLKDLEKLSDYYSVPNNMGLEFGAPYRIKQLKMNQGLPVWSTSTRLLRTA